MTFWRISSYADLTGRGGVLAGGRWHTAGRPVVYLAGTPAGAMLEILVHLEIDQEDFPETFQLLKVELPDDASLITIPDLKPGWKADLNYTRMIGDAFLTRSPALLLAVPSVIMPHTLNYLFNPLHPEAAAAMIHAEMFSLDPRLIKMP